MSTGKIGLTLDCLYEPPLARADAEYLHYLGRLLNSPPRLVKQQSDTETANKAQIDPDLLVYWEPERPFWQRWLGITPAVRVVNRTASSVLIMKYTAKKRPCWPIRRILLILRAHKSDEAAICWLSKLARPTHADLFILPLIPAVPAMYRYGCIPQDIEVLLAPNTFSGAQLHRLARLCQEWGIQGELLLQNCDPLQRIAWATTTSNCDLIILSDEPYPWIHRCLLGELVRPLLQSAHCPILIARNTSVTTSS